MITATTENNAVNVTLKGNGDTLIDELSSIFLSVADIIAKEENMPTKLARVLLNDEITDFCDKYDQN